MAIHAPSSATSAIHSYGGDPALNAGSEPGLEPELSCSGSTLSGSHPGTPSQCDAADIPLFPDCCRSRSLSPEPWTAPQACQKRPLPSPAGGPDPPLAKCLRHSSRDHVADKEPRRYTRPRPRPGRRKTRATGSIDLDEAGGTGTGSSTSWPPGELLVVDDARVLAKNREIEAEHRRAVAEAEEKFRATGDVAAFWPLLAPFMSSTEAEAGGDDDDDDDDDERSPWQWSCEAERFYRHHPGTRSVIWAPTLDSFR
jgi:hypothetical protein